MIKCNIRTWNFNYKLQIFLFSFFLQMALEFLLTIRGFLSLIVDGHRFRKDKDRQTCITWRCCTTTCKSRCSTDLDKNDLLTPPSPHNHETPSQAAIDMERARTSIKRKAEDAPDQNPNKIVCAEAHRYESLSYSNVSALTQVFNSTYYIVR